MESRTTRNGPRMQGERVLQEATIQAGLQAKAQSSLPAPSQHTLQAEVDPHILELRGYTVNFEQEQARFYLLYTPHRSLRELTTAYNAFNQRLPEPFAWTLFHSLTLGLKTMQGQLDEEAAQHRSVDGESTIRTTTFYTATSSLATFSSTMHNLKMERVWIKPIPQESTQTI